MSGYDLRQLIQTSIGHFWSESFGQIYPTLHALSADGLIERVKAVDRVRLNTKQKPDRKRQEYAITQAGIQALESWLRIPARTQPARNELLLKLFFGSRAACSVAVLHVEARRDKARQDLDTYKQAERKLHEEKTNDRSLPFWRITLRYGQSMAEAELRWSEETLKVLQSLCRKTSAKGRQRP